LTKDWSKDLPKIKTPGDFIQWVEAAEKHIRGLEKLSSDLASFPCASLDEVKESLKGDCEVVKAICTGWVKTND
jgi:hypothetical protein